MSVVHSVIKVREKKETVGEIRFPDRLIICDASLLSTYAYRVEPRTSLMVVPRYEWSSQSCFDCSFDRQRKLL